MNLFLYLRPEGVFVICTICNDHIEASDALIILSSNIPLINTNNLSWYIKRQL